MSFSSNFLADFGRSEISDEDIAEAEAFATSMEVFELVDSGKRFEDAVVAFAEQSSQNIANIAGIVEDALRILGIEPAERENAESRIVIGAAVAAQNAILEGR